nr:low temperature requirement protein A [Micromonospora sp. DSM 115978]
MSGSRGEGLGKLLRQEASSQRATFLELFLDLVFVFALTRVSQRLATDFIDERRILVSEAGQTLLLFLALWLVWSTTVWATSHLEPAQPAVQLLVALTVFGAMVMAVALPEGFGGHGLVFATAYVAVQVGRSMILLLATHGRGERLALLRVLIWAGLTGVPWIVGGVVGESPARGLLWTLALGLDYAVAVLGYPVPGLGRSTGPGQGIAGEHLAERYQQFLLIALGETILLLGFTYSGGEFTDDRTVGFVLALCTTVLFWRIYFFRAGQLLPAAISGARDPARLGGASGLAHLLMVIGIVLTGVGYELFVDHPGAGEPAWLCAILGGPALFLIGRAYFEYQVFTRVSGVRVTGAVSLAVLAPALIGRPMLAAGAVGCAVLVGVAAADALRSRRAPGESPAPRG